MLRISPPTRLIVGGDPIHRALGALGGACDESNSLLMVWYSASLAPPRRGSSFVLTFKARAFWGVRFFAPAFFICTPSCFSGAPATALKEKIILVAVARTLDGLAPRFLSPKDYLAGLALVGNAL